MKSAKPTLDSENTKVASSPLYSFGRSDFWYFHTSLAPVSSPRPLRSPVSAASSPGRYVWRCENLPSSRRTRPRSLSDPFVCANENALSAASTRLSKSALNSLSGVSRSGSRFAQNSSMNALASASLLICSYALRSALVSRKPAGESGNAAYSCESCAPTTDAAAHAASARGIDRNRMKSSSFPPRAVTGRAAQ